MILLTLAAFITLVSSQGVVVTTQYGPVQGELAANNTVRVWRSIPFAAPPTGPFRFKAPQPPQPWTAVKDVRPYSTPCPQLQVVGGLFYGGEDCLQLSVYAPLVADKLPVLVWFFGGGYALGDGVELGWYDGVNLVNKFPGFIIVAGNYRVGPLGFMALNSLQAEDGTTGNAALLDQLSTLQWVKDNIAAFGGDPDRVTISGESAGAFSVAWHIASPGSAGLFHGAILESGTFDAPQFFQPVSDAIAFNTLYSAAVGCDVDPVTKSDAVTLECMRKLPVADLLLSIADYLNPNWPCVTPGRDCQTSTLKHIPALAPLMPWGPAIEGKFLTDTPLHLIKAGKFNKVPILQGTNKDEGSIFAPVFPLILPGTNFPATVEQIGPTVDHLFDMYDPAFIRNLTTTLILPAYPLSAYANNTWTLVSDMVTHAFFTCGTRRSSRALRAAGVPVFLYHFSYDVSHWPEVALLPELGNYHTSELDFVFGNNWPLGVHGNATVNDVFMTKAFENYWVNFVTSGDPSVGSGVDLPWPMFNSPDEVNMELAFPLSITSHLEEEVCDNAWDPFYAAIDAAAAPLRTRGKEWYPHLQARAALHAAARKGGL